MKNREFYKDTYVTFNWDEKRNKVQSILRTKDKVIYTSLHYWSQEKSLEEIYDFLDKEHE